jgi:hypothetical protein
MWCIGTGKQDHIISSGCSEWHYTHKEYELTQCCGSKILYFSANPMPKRNYSCYVEADAAQVSIVLEKIFGEIAIKGRQGVGKF